MSTLDYVRYPSIPKMLEGTQKCVPDKVALKYFEGEEIKSITFREYYNRAKLIGAGLLQLGVKNQDHLGIFSETRYEWCVCDIGIMTINCCTVTIFHTLESEQVKFILSDSESVGVFVSNQKLLDKVLKGWKGLPLLEHIIVIDNIIPNLDEYFTEDEKLIYADKIVTLKQLLDAGKKATESDPNQVQQIMDAIREEELATIIYTSGTTGIPKGVMLSHKNMLSDITMAAIALDLRTDETSTTYLPLSHSFCRTVELLGGCLKGITLCFAKNYYNLAENIHDFHPTSMIGVPTVFEQIYHKALDTLAKMPKSKQDIFWNAVAFGKKVCEIEQSGKKVPLIMTLKFKLYKKLVFGSIRQRLGGRLRRFVSGGAPLNPEIARFFFAAGVLILEGYGLTEASPVTHVNRESTTTNAWPPYRFGTVGSLIGWNKQGTKNPYEPLEHKLSESGELMVKGPNVMMGYWKRPKETAEALEDGWLHTGDLAEIDIDGYVKIIGRSKEIIVLRTGKKVAPNLIEGMYLENNYIAQLMLVGEAQSFITALIVPNFEKKQEILDQLNMDAEMSNEDFCQDPKITEFYDQQLKQIEENRISKVESIKKFILVPDPFTEENNLMTPTMKLKRKLIIKKFEKPIAEMYEKNHVTDA
jgi:long-chain acyl-CoA synthetase